LFISLLSYLPLFGGKCPKGDEGIDKNPTIPKYTLYNMLYEKPYSAKE
jgi:hypothetical protein